MRVLKKYSQAFLFICLIIFVCVCVCRCGIQACLEQIQTHQVFALFGILKALKQTFMEINKNV